MTYSLPCVGILWLSSMCSDLRRMVHIVVCVQYNNAKIFVGWFDGDHVAFTLKCCNGFVLSGSKIIGLVSG